MGNCRSLVDIAFIVDSSGSISKRNWLKMKEFLWATINQFVIRDYAAHVAIIAYSTTPKVELKFNQLGNRLKASEVWRIVQTIRHQYGFTFIDKALRLAEREVFTEASGMRKNVPKVFRVFGITNTLYSLSDALINCSVSTQISVFVYICSFAESQLF